MKLQLLLASLLVVLTGCAPRYLAGTRIQDTPETRSVLQVMERYRSALEARDAQALQGLVSPAFRDNGGTESPEDDLTYKDLKAVLPQVFARISETRVDLDVKSLDVQGRTAIATYYWSAHWRMPALGNKPQRESELEQMTLEKVDGEWKILSGL